MQSRKIYYVPPAFVEAVGWATIGWAQLETAIDILLAIGAEAGEGGERRTSARGPLSLKIDALKRMSVKDGLTRDWQNDLIQLATAALRFDEDLHNAVQGTLYGRGIDSASLEMRRLYEKTQAAPIMSRMTLGSVNELTEELAAQTRKAISMAIAMGEKSGLLDVGWCA